MILLSTICTGLEIDLHDCPDAFATLFLFFGGQYTVNLGLLHGSTIYVTCMTA